MVSARILQKMRQRTERFLTETCDIERESDSRGSMGEPSHNYVPVAKDVPCRLITQRAGPQQGSQLLARQEILKDEYRLILKAGTEIDIDYRVIHNGRTYEVVSVLDQRTDETDVQAILTRAR